MQTARSNALRGWVTGLSVGLVVVLGARAQAIRRLELLSVDARMRFASPAEAPPVAIVGITQEDVRDDRRGPLPWARADYAKAVTRLHELGAKVIVFDLYFPRPSKHGPADDAALVEAVRTAGNVILPTYAKVDPRRRYGRLEQGVRWLDLPPEDYLERNLPALEQAAARQGHINLSAHDPDHLFRRVPVAIGFRSGKDAPVFYALSVEAAAALQADDGWGDGEGRAGKGPDRGDPSIRVHDGRLHIGERSWPLDPDFEGCLQIDFSGVSRKIDFHASQWRAPWGRDRSVFLYSYSELMRPDFPKSAVAGRIVFVGSLLYERHPDVHPTPAGQQPGVIIHALGTQTLLGRRHLHWLPFNAQAAVTLALSAAAALGCFVCRFRWSLAVFGGALLGLTGASYALFEVDGLLIETVGPAMGLGVIFIFAVANTVAVARRALGKRERELDTLVEMGRLSASLMGAGAAGRGRLLGVTDADVLVPPLGSGVAAAAETVGATIRHVLGAEVAVCYLADDEGGELRAVAASGADIEDLPDEILSAGRTAAQRAVSERHPVLWREDKRRAEASEIGAHGQRERRRRVSELLCVPMAIGGRLAGAMAFFNKTATTVSPGEHFSSDDLRLVRSLTDQAAVTLENARLYESMHGLFFDAIKSLAAAIDAKDPYTRGHTARVAQLCGDLGQRMSLTSSELQVLHLAATLHDIGKIAIPEAVLNKPTGLTAEERRLVEKHPARGAIILEPVRQLRSITPGIRHHHERFDGCGYPDGLAGEAIPLLARVIAVADAFDAMTTDRPYRRALTNTEAVDEMARCSGSQFDAELVELFLERFPTARTVQVGAPGL